MPVNQLLFPLIRPVPQPTPGSFFPLASSYPPLSPTQSALPPTFGPCDPALLRSQLPAGGEAGEWYVWSPEGTESGPLMACESWQRPDLPMGEKKVQA